MHYAGDTIIQEMFYNGWTNDHYVGNVIVFPPSGLIMSCALHAPGSVHDLQICDWCVNMTSWSKHKMNAVGSLSWILLSAK